MIARKCLFGVALLALCSATILGMARVASAGDADCYLQVYRNRSGPPYIYSANGCTTTTCDTGGATCSMSVTANGYTICSCFALGAACVEGYKDDGEGNPWTGGDGRCELEICPIPMCDGIWVAAGAGTQQLLCSCE